MLSKVNDLVKITGSKEEAAKALCVRISTLNRWYYNKRIADKRTRERLDFILLQLGGMKGDIRQARRAWRRWRPNRVEGFIDGDGI